MELATSIIALLAAIIGLVTAIVSLRASRRNRRDISRQSSDLEALFRVASNINIESPKDGDEITDLVYDGMKGGIEGQLPENHQLWVLARDSHNFFLMYPPTQVTATMNAWNQTNVRLDAPGRWELHICLADESASNWFKSRASREDFSGFSSLPNGADTIQYVVVKKV